MTGDNKHSFRKEFLLSEEGTVFVLGSVLLIVWVGAIVLLWRFSHPLWMHILTMGFAQTLAGRAAAIAQGTHIEMHWGLIALLATYADVVFVCLTYPPLVFSYRNVIEGPFFEKHMKPVLESAEKSTSRFTRFQAVGVFLFVWLPFHMTGVLVGAVLGYLLGLKTWINMITVTIATMSASLCWVLAYDRFFHLLGGIHPSIPVVAAVVIIGGLMTVRWMRNLRQWRRSE